MLFRFWGFGYIYCVVVGLFICFFFGVSFGGMVGWGVVVGFM